MALLVPGLDTADVTHHKALKQLSWLARQMGTSVCRVVLVKYDDHLSTTAHDDTTLDQNG